MKTTPPVPIFKIRIPLTAMIAAVLAFSACERKTVTREEIQPADPVAKTTTFETSTLGAAIDAFEKAPAAENQSAVNLAFAKLDSEIAELDDRVVKTDGAERAEASAKANNLKSYREAERLRFTKAQAGTAFDTTPAADSRSATQKVEDAAEKVGDKVEEGARKVGETLENAAKKTGEAIKDETH
jgi:hypothetical protein